MDISSVGGSAMTPEVQAQYAVKALAKCTEELTASLERLL